jgi:putative transport protein
MQFIVELIRNHPELAIFLTLGIGFLIGKIQFGSFKFGAVLGTLFAGLLVGQLDIPINSVVKIFFFDLFLFATGYKVGPQFFQGLKKDALPQLAVTLVVCVTSLFTAYLVAKIMHYDMGIAAGLIAGTFTESTIIGTAAEAIQRLSISDIEKTNLINNIPIAYAATYLVGTTAVILFLPEIAPKILRINLANEAKKFESDLSKKNSQNSAIFPFNQPWDVRVFKVENPGWVGITIAEIENKIPDARIIVEKIKINDEIVDPESSGIVNHGDLIVISARKDVMLKVLEIGEEIFDKDLLNIEDKKVNLVITKSNISGMILSELGEKYGKGIKLHRLIRSTLELPFAFNTKVSSGDLLEVSGNIKNIERTAKEIGYLEKLSIPTDIVFVSMGILLGGLIGFLSVEVGGIDLTLTTSGGALVMGLFLGWLRSKRPTFGRIPDSALWLFDNLGLTVFIGVVGIQSGPGLINGLNQTGYFILLSGLIVAVLPHIIGLLFGHYILRISPVILLGVLSGAGTNTSALKAVQEKALSKYPVLGYTIPYALGNILLTAWGPVIVSMMS